MLGFFSFFLTPHKKIFSLVVFIARFAIWLYTQSLQAQSDNLCKNRDIFLWATDAAEYADNESASISVSLRHLICTYTPVCIFLVNDTSYCGNTHHQVCVCCHGNVNNNRFRRTSCLATALRCLKSTLLKQKEGSWLRSCDTGWHYHNI